MEIRWKIKKKEKTIQLTFNKNFEIPYYLFHDH